MSKKQQIEELQQRVEDLEDKLEMPWVYSSPLYKGLYERTTGLWAKFSRLYEYLGVEEITEPERKLIRKKRVVRAATKPKKQTKGKRVSP